MRYPIQNKVAVRTDQSCEIHVPIVNAQVVALANQPLDDLDHRALSEIVSARLETESEHPHLQTAAVHHQPDPARNLHLIAGKDRVEDGHLEIMDLCLI